MVLHPGEIVRAQRELRGKPPVAVRSRHERDGQRVRWDGRLGVHAEADVGSRAMDGSGSDGEAHGVRSIFRRIRREVAERHWATPFGQGWIPAGASHPPEHRRGAPEGVIAKNPPAGRLIDELAYGRHAGAAASDKEAPRRAEA